jgi:hypothetical protein
MTKTPASITYSSVVSRDSVRIVFLLAALNGLDVCVADVGNAYLNADCQEKIWTTAGPEFQSDAGAVMIMKKARYGLKSLAAGQALFASTLTDLGFKGSYADPDVWIQPSTIDGVSYYEMILVYIDDILCISKDTQRIMNHILKIHRLKEGSIKAPDRYLGANIGLWTMEGGRRAWSMSAKSYIKSAVSNLESKMDRMTIANILPSKSYQPFKTGYRPEIDVSPILPPLQAVYSAGYANLEEWISSLKCQCYCHTMQCPDRDIYTQQLIYSHTSNHISQQQSYSTTLFQTLMSADSNVSIGPTFTVTLKRLCHLTCMTRWGSQCICIVLLMLIIQVTLLQGVHTLV